MNNFLPYLNISILATLLLAGCTHQPSARDRANDELRAATIAYVTDLEGGMQLDPLDKHISELKVLYSQHESLLNPEQRHAYATLQLSSETLDQAAVYCISHGHRVIIKAQAELLTLSPADYEASKKLYGQQVVVSKAAAEAASQAKQFLATLTPLPPVP